MTSTDRRSGRAVAMSWQSVGSGVRECRIEVPVTWSVVDDDGRTRCLAPQGGFPANVVVRPERLPLDAGLVELVEAVLADGWPDQPLSVRCDQITGQGWSTSVARCATRFIAGHKIRQLVVAVEDADVPPTDQDRAVYVLVGSCVVDGDCNCCSGDDQLLRRIITSFTLGDTA